METLNVQSFYGIFKDISLIVHSSVQLDEVFELVVWKVTEAFQAKGALLRVHNPQTDQFEVTAVYGMNEQYLSKGAVSTEKIVDGDIKNKKPVIIEDLWNEPRVEYPQWAWDEGVRMIVDTPLYLGDKLISILRLYFTEKRSFSNKDLEFLVAIATQCACAINKIKLIESQQDQFEQLAIQTEKLSALGRMAAGIAHEINNPLAGILLYSTHMKKKLPKESPLKENLDVIISETTRCKSTIQELLDFSREREPVKSLRNINAIIKRAMDILENEFYLKHITLNTHLSGDIPEVPLDANQIEQVLINLLLNSIQAISRKDGVIQVRSRINENRTNLVVEIEDNGCGIASKNLDKIFDPFFTTKANGSGLGMSVSYGIVQNHKGDIQVSSKEGRGTRFCITIPVGSDGQTSAGDTRGHEE
ncbi:MAG: GAF domain-containing protein [Desulfohalobiaceae bacterium]|nr:GAF domain-containing protein [Desulfohalobiaceae bacterium]